ncbi:MAG: aldo/keto reductase [Planctomycetota bacterium]|nr:aldo/keto reductase [Planctomycetota bacterium]
MSALDVPPRTLGRTGLEVSPLGYGSVPIGRAPYPSDDAGRLLNTLLDSGITLLDTAAAYGKAEQEIGTHVAHRRDEYTLVTKTGATDNYAPAWSAREMRETTERSLRRLKADVVDVVLLHTCDLDMLRAGEVVDGVQELRERGLARWVGYSGDSEALSYALGLGVFDVIEASYSPLDQANRDLLKQAAEQDVGVLLKRPLANGVPGRTSAPEDEYAGQYWPRWQALELTRDDIGGLEWPEASLRFAAYAGGVTCALTGSGSLANMQANMAAINAGPLPADVVENLERRFDERSENWLGLT